MSPTTPHQSPGRHRAWRAEEFIELGLAMDPDARSATVARLIAATLCDQPTGALERFASTGRLDAQAALAELNQLKVPLQQEPWVQALGHHILLTVGQGDNS